MSPIVLSQVLMTLFSRSLQAAGEGLAQESSLQSQGAQ